VLLLVAVGGSASRPVAVFFAAGGPWPSSRCWRCRLARAGAGLNPQVDASFFDPLPEIAALRLDDLAGGRVFSYGLDHSPAFSEVLGRGGPALTLTGLYLTGRSSGPTRT
jgi:hypothetical protein